MTDKVIEQIKSFAYLEHGWDGYRAGPISDDIIVKSLQMYDKVKGMHDWWAVPCSCGDAIQIEAHEEGMDIEIYIGK